LKGIYVLIIEINKTISATIGTKGELTFPAGLYAYVGSAQNNLEKRVERHLKKEKRFFWHIDYLLNNEVAKVTAVYYVEGQKAQECRIAAFLAANGAVPVLGFGCSDCSCVSHLFKDDGFGFIEEKMRRLSSFC
jgi:Uri superfamily endonuclease